MRSDIKPGGIFPDYALPDHTNVVRKLSEIQGDDPLVLTLARAITVRRSTSSTWSWLRTIRRWLSPTPRSPRSRQTTTTLNSRVPRLSRRPMDLSLRSRSDDSKGPGHPGVHRPRAQPDDPPHACPQAGTSGPQRLQRVLVLGPSVVRRPLARLARGVERDLLDWDLSKSGLREAWDASDYANFHGWNKRVPQSAPTSYET